MRGLRADIRVQHADGFQVRADIEVASGETVALLGPNGAGKSTIVQVIAGVVPPDRSTVSLDEIDLTDVDPADRQVGLVFQDGLLFPNMTVRENVEFAARRDTGDLVDQFALADILEQRPATLSGGEAQRAALARTLASDPRVLLLDEPTSALDSSARSATRKILGRILDRFAGPKILVTHDAAEAFALADNIFVIEDGRVVQSGRPEDLRSRPATAYVAEFAGVNFIRGSAQGGSVDVGGFVFSVADVSVEGDVILSIHPTAVTLHLGKPQGSARNRWQTRVSGLEDLGGRVRVQLDQPVRITAEVTPQSVDSLRIEEGSSVWASLKATEISVGADV